ncbi:hypothetical protein HOU03_gp405 [Caulobacter phage CcrSC]|uniref:Uncharacterized protein n=1 Tax=Caulobacter phage CcrSC TaxID=2283272 RepID=A0A385EDM1_9CAUD|nr:hypothetical protein HOU03_gp405 [Caulobacter phage CcrSC]AXQ69863.1 hypothetical protein CcrSC_gp281 [Caulobacter phage CcrSC]
MLEHALERLIQITAGVEVELKGDPAQIASRRLRLAAQINAERVETAVERLSRLAAEAATHLEGENDPRLKQLVIDIRAAIGDAKEAGKIE